MLAIAYLLIAQTQGAPSTEWFLRLVAEKGMTFALLVAAIWLMSKKLMAQYEVRIDALERSSNECQEDRKDLHKAMHQLQSDHVDALKSIINQK